MRDEDLDILEVLQSGKYKYSKIGEFRWTREEVAQLLKLLAIHGNNYKKIGKELNGITAD